MTVFMRKVFLSIILVLTAAFALTGCTKNSDNPNNGGGSGETPNPPVSNDFSVIATLKGYESDSRTTMNDNLSLTWENNDAINVFHAASGSESYVNDGQFKYQSDNKFHKSAGITLNSGNYDWYAFYPYEAAVTTPANNTTPVYVGCKSNESQVQNGNDSPIHLAGGNYHLAGKAANVAHSACPTITMNHISSYAKIHITNGVVDKSIIVKDITLSLAGRRLVGQYSIDFTNPLECVFNAGSSVSSKAKLTVNNGAAIASGASADFYLGFVPQSLAADERINIVVNASIASDAESVSQTKEITLAAETEFKAGHIKTLNFTFDKGSGSGSDVTDFTVTTLNASNVDKAQATLCGSYTNTQVRVPREAGFEWGTSATSLTNTLQWDDAPSFNSANFNQVLYGLSQGITYYYRAYVMEVRDGVSYYYRGTIKSFTTLSDGTVATGDQKGWYELPLMNITKSGSYMTNTDNSTEYYAYHLCAGSEKGPTGATARNYTVCYSSTYHCPVWVAAPRHRMYVGSASRTDAYGQDANIPSNIQYKSKSTGGGCNKGHMLGSAERTSSSATNRQVFYYTNIAPQLSSGYNTGGGGWNKLEDYIDGLVCADTLYEVVGCYFKTYTDGYGYTVQPQTISFGGLNNVTRPTMFYYAVIRTKRGNTGKALKDCSASELQCVAFVRSHTNSLKGQAVTSRELMSIADLERLTGITYFANVPNAPKNTFNASDWGL